MRSKESKISIDSGVARRVTEMVNSSEKTQMQIANELGYQKANIITMFKQGVTKVPLSKAGALARACDADPLEFLRLCLDEYSSETLKAIEETMGELLSRNERRLIARLRELSAASSRELQLTQDALDRFAEFAETYLLEPRPAR